MSHKIFIDEMLIILIIHKISLIRLTMGGAAILIIILNTQKKEIKGKQESIPFLIKILRENLRV